MQWIEKNAAYVLLFVVVVGAVLLWGQSRLSSNMVAATLDWQDFSGTPGSPTGFLVTLHNQAADATIYISSDKATDPSHQTLAAGWELTTLQEQTIWNPRLCAQVPSVTTPTGHILMLDTYKRDNAFLDRLVWFNPADGTLLEADAAVFGHLHNGMFVDDAGKPYFFGVSHGYLFAHSFDPETEILSSNPLRAVNVGDNFIVRRSAADLPVIEIFNEAVVTTERFEYKNNSLQPFSGELAGPIVSFPDETTEIRQLTDDVTVTSSLDTAYAKDIAYQGETVLTYVPDERVFTYVVDAY